MAKRSKMRIPEVLTEEERMSLMAQPNREAPTGLRNLCMMTLMVNTGLRVAEVLNLKVSDINWATGRLKVNEGKGKRDRVLWIGEPDLDLLKQWQTVKEEHKKYGPTLSGTKTLFTTLDGNMINDRYVRSMVKRLGKKAGIEKDVHPHMLRHSFATDIYRETKNIRLVQKALGHSNLSTTQIYTHIVDEELEEAMKFFRTGSEPKEVKVSTE